MINYQTMTRKPITTNTITNIPILLFFHNGFGHHNVMSRSTRPAARQKEKVCETNKGGKGKRGSNII